MPSRLRSERFGAEVGTSHFLAVSRSATKRAMLRELANPNRDSTSMIGMVVSVLTVIAAISLLVGHSFGGVITQMLADRGVAVDHVSL